MAKFYDLSFSEGETFYFQFELRDAAGLPLDLTDGSVEWAVASEGSATSFNATTGNGMIFITSATGGEGYVRIDPVDHAILPAGEYSHELRAILSNGLVSLQITGRLTIGDSVFTDVSETGSFRRSTGLQMIYSSSTADADPGDGYFRFNSDKTIAYIDLEDRYGVDITAWLDVLDESTNGSPYGFLRFTKVGQESTWYEFAISDLITDATGYRKVPIAFVSGAGSLIDGDGFALSFSRTGDGASDQSENNDLLDSVRAGENSVNVDVLSPGATIGGVTFTEAGVDDFLLNAQDDPTENGVYVWNGAVSAATRRDDADEDVEFRTGMLVPIDEGDWGGGVWRLVTPGPFTLGLTEIHFVRLGRGFPWKRIAAFPYTIVDLDNNKELLLDNGASDVVINVGDAMGHNAEFNARVKGTGTATFVAADGFDILSPHGLVITTQYGWVNFKRKGNTAWYVHGNIGLESFCVACSDETTAITAGTAKVTFRMPYPFTLMEVRASLTTAQTSGTLVTVDVNESGTSVLSTPITIDNGEKTSTTAATPAVISDAALADDAEMTIDFDHIGDGTAKGLKVTLIGHQ